LVYPGKDECRYITLKVGRVSCNAYDEIENEVRNNVGTINERHEDKECKEDGNGEEKDLIKENLMRRNL